MLRTDFEPINSFDRRRAQAFHETFCRIDGREQPWVDVEFRYKKTLIRTFAELRSRGLL